MANKHSKIWKVVSHKPVSGKQTRPLSSNLIFHTRTKYIEVDYHFVHDRIATKDIQIHFISYNDQLVDVLFKSLPCSSFVHLWSKLYMGILFSA
jgi:hypothetical protein